LSGKGKKKNNCVLRGKTERLSSLTTREGKEMGGKRYSAPKTRPPGLFPAEGGKFFMGTPLPSTGGREKRRIIEGETGNANILGGGERITITFIRKPRVRLGAYSPPPKKCLKHSSRSEEEKQTPKSKQTPTLGKRKFSSRKSGRGEGRKGSSSPPRV